MLKECCVCSTLCDPYLNLFRGLIPPIGGTLDLSPILAFIVLDVSPPVTTWKQPCCRSVAAAVHVGLSPLIAHLSDKELVVFLQCELPGAGFCSREHALHAFTAAATGILPDASAPRVRLTEVGIGAVESGEKSRQDSSQNREFACAQLFSNTAAALPAEVGAHGRASMERRAAARRFRALNPTRAALAWHKRIAAQRQQRQVQKLP